MKLPMNPLITVWHRIDRALARLRPHRQPIALLIDALVIAVCWNLTYLFRLGFERWLHARPGYDGWVMLAVIAVYLSLFVACGASRASVKSSASRSPAWPAGCSARWRC
jgi:hypothetical protein